MHQGAMEFFSLDVMDSKGAPLPCEISESSVLMLQNSRSGMTSFPDSSFTSSASSSSRCHCVSLFNSKTCEMSLIPSIPDQLLTFTIARLPWRLCLSHFTFSWRLDSFFYQSSPSTSFPFPFVFDFLRFQFIYFSFSSTFRSFTLEQSVKIVEYWSIGSL